MNLQGVQQSVSLKALRFSETPAQVERRAHLDKGALTELAESIKSVGVAQAILVRPAKDDVRAFEIVAGERRVLAAKQAGLQEIPALVRDLDDGQVQELQLVENLQRQDLHELAEAEGYEALAKLGRSVEEIAAKVGKSKATVYARMKLLDLAPEGRKAYYAGKISASIALLIARIPVAELQAKALEHILKPCTWRDEPLSYREAVRFVHDQFTLRLSEAPFPRADADLVPAAGACGPCPKRTGNQPELFGDIKGADVCTDPKCFGAKRGAWNRIQIAQAKEKGLPIVTGGEAKKAHSKWSKDLQGYVRPTDKCDADPKRRTYAQLIGKTEVPEVLLQNPDSGRFTKVYKVSEVNKALKDKGVKIHDHAADERSSRSRYAADEAKRAKEELVRRAIFKRVMEHAPSKLGRAELEGVVRGLAENNYGYDDYFAFTGQTTKAKTFDKMLFNLSDAQLSQAVYGLILWEHVDHSPYRGEDTLLAAAKKHGIDVKKVRAELAATELAKPAKPK